MKERAKGKPKLSDTERHERFVAMAKEVGASEKSKDFDDAFARVADKNRMKSKTESSTS